MNEQDIDKQVAEINRRLSQQGLHESIQYERKELQVMIEKEREIRKKRMAPFITWLKEREQEYNAEKGDEKDELILQKLWKSILQRTPFEEDTQ